MIQALRPDRIMAMGHRVVGTILGESFMHDAEQGLDLASVVEHEVCLFAFYLFMFVCLFVMKFTVSFKESVLLRAWSVFD